MRAMFESVAPTLRTGRRILSKSISVMTGEGDIASVLTDIQLKWDSVEIGSYPFVKDGNYGTSLVLRSSNIKILELAYEELLQNMDQISVLYEVED